MKRDIFHLNGRRSTKTETKELDRRDIPPTHSIDNLASGLITKQRSGDGSDVRQREDLAQHTLVHPVRKLYQVTLALVVYALGACLLRFLRWLMDMQRRKDEHRQVDCQQQPRSYMSLRHRIHATKL
jgi:hypothetical protein